LAKDDFAICGGRFLWSDDEAVTDIEFGDRAAMFEPIGIDHHPHVLGTEIGQRTEGISRAPFGPGLEIPAREQKRGDASRSVEVDPTNRVMGQHEANVL
jgi:hypothetical protein